MYRTLGYNYEENKKYCGLPEKVYMQGVSDIETDKWLEILKEKGRIPYIRYPIVCARCGKLYPEFFDVSDEEWNKYIEPNKRGSVLCKNCYDKIKLLIDSAN